MEEGSGNLWQLYCEGFAQRCEHLVLGCENWHQATGVNDPGWLDWCHEHKGWLAAEFLAVADCEEEAASRPFFGHWYDIQGRRQCGYYLGHEVIKELEVNLSLRQIALLDEVDEQMRRSLQDMVCHDQGPA